MVISEFDEKFCRIKNLNETIVYRKSFLDSTEVNNFVNGIDQILASSLLIKDEENVKAGMTLWKNKKIFIKQYLRTNLFYRIKDLFRISRAMKVFRVSYTLEYSMVLFPKVLMVIEKKNFGFLQESYLVLEAVEDLIKTANYNEMIFGSRDTFESFFKKVIHLISTLHNLKISHGDCKLSNFFVINAMESDYHVGVFDLDGAKKHSRITTKKRVKDVSRFFASICEYCQKNNVEFFVKDEIPQVFLDQLLNLYKKDTGLLLNICSVKNLVNKFLKRKQIFGILK